MAAAAGVKMAPAAPLTEAEQQVGTMLSSLETAMRIAAEFEPVYRAAARWACPRCLSTMVLPTRDKSVWVRLARRAGVQVCRCHQCGKRSVWW